MDGEAEHRQSGNESNTDLWEACQRTMRGCDSPSEEPLVVYADVEEKARATGIWGRWRGGRREVRLEQSELSEQG